MSSWRMHSSISDFRIYLRSSSLETIGDGYFSGTGCLLAAVIGEGDFYFILKLASLTFSN